MSLAALKARVDFEDWCLKDFSQRLRASGYTYKQFIPAYEYGWRLASDDRYRGQEWAAVEAGAHGQWERENPNTWDQVKDAVHRTFVQMGV